jgi:hypothetical protein
MKPLALLFLISLCFIIVSCHVLEPENDLDPIEGKVIFSVTYDSTHILYDHTGYLLLLKTEKIYSCFNFKIKTIVSVNHGKIDVQLLGIDPEGDVCLTAEGPATALKPLALSNGNYSLDIKYRLKSDKYSLSVNNLSVNVDPVDTDFTVYQSFNFNF